MLQVSTQLDASVNYLRGLIKRPPQVAVVLGSGLAALENLQDAIAVPYGDIPHFPVSTVVGHSGLMTFGDWEGTSVVVLRGRFHRYEGYPFSQVVYPITVLAQLGLKQLMLTNAAGGVNLTYRPGDLMLIRENHDYAPIDVATGESAFNLENLPLRGNPYSAALQARLLESAHAENIALKEGAYASVLGPSYETPSEINMIRILAGDAVGMSTIPEANWAAHLGIQPVALSCITNATSSTEALASVSHDEVIDVAKGASEKIDRLFKRFLSGLSV